MTKQKKLQTAVILNIVLFILEVIGGYLYFQRGGWNFIEFYTEDSNTLTMAACLLTAIYEYQMLKGKREALPGWLQELKYISAVGLTLTFLVVIFILIPMQKDGNGAYMFLLQGSMLYHHLLCPILLFITYLWFDPLDAITKKQTALTVIPTLIYAAVLIMLNIFKVLEGPYPFLRVYDQPVYMSIVWVIVILGAAYGIAFLLGLLLNRIQKHNSVAENSK